MHNDNSIEGLLTYLESRVEQHLQQAIQLFQNLDEAVLLKPSAIGGWSIAQCLWHLNSYGHFYLPQIQNVLSSVNRKQYYRRGWLGDYFIRMMESGGKQKYKAFKNHAPPADINAHAVVAEFIEQQETMMDYLKRARNSNLEKRLPVSISNLITLKLGDVFQFVIAHNERHVQQALRNVQG